MVELAYPSAILFTKTSLLHVVRPTGRRRATRIPDAPVYHYPHCPVLYLPSTVQRSGVLPPFWGGMTLARFLRIRWEVLKKTVHQFLARHPPYLARTCVRLGRTLFKAVLLTLLPASPENRFHSKWTMPAPWSGVDTVEFVRENRLSSFQCVAGLDERRL